MNVIKELELVTEISTDCEGCTKPFSESPEDQYKRHGKLPIKYWFYCKECLRIILEGNTKDDIIDMLVN